FDDAFNGFPQWIKRAVTKCSHGYLQSLLFARDVSLWAVASSLVTCIKICLRSKQCLARTFSETHIPLGSGGYPQHLFQTRVARQHTLATVLINRSAALARVA